MPSMTDSAAGRDGIPHKPAARYTVFMPVYHAHFCACGVCREERRTEREASKRVIPVCVIHARKVIETQETVLTLDPERCVLCQSTGQ